MPKTRKGGNATNKRSRFALAALFALYVAFTLRMTLFGTRASELSPLKDYFIMRSNLRPFKTIFSYVRAIRLGTPYFKTAVKNIIGNTFLFMPLPVFLALFFPKCKNFFFNMGCVFSLILTIEAFQILTRRGSFDVDDLFLNTLGALFGFIFIFMRGRPFFAGLRAPHPRRPF